jgi:hypothetical protein
MTTIADQTGTRGYKPRCEKLPELPTIPELPARAACPPHCNCPTPPGGPQSSCLESLISAQNIIVRKAERSKAVVELLTSVQDQVASAQATYTSQRFVDLRKLWKDQDALIVELIRKLVCAVGCWECLLECRLCNQLVKIRTLEEQLHGAGPLTTEVYSLFDLLAWHQRNVAQVTATVKRITSVIEAWKDPSQSLGDVLDVNGALINDTQSIIATDPAKAVYDVFMTLIPQHWAIRPRDEGPKGEWKSAIDPKYVNICECPPTPRPPAPTGGDEGKEQAQQTQQETEKPSEPPKCSCDDGDADICCGPDVGVLNLRQRLIGPLPYIVAPAQFPDIMCCLTRERLLPASEQLATAEANLDNAAKAIELTTTEIADRIDGIAASFRAELVNPIDCSKYTKLPPTGETGDTQSTTRAAP